MSAQIIPFPVGKRMPTRIAEEKIGGIIRFKYPDNITDVVSWFNGWCIGKSVLIGWTPLNQGLVKGLKGSLVRHVVSDIVSCERGTSPEIEIACKYDSYFISNWKGSDNLKKGFVPAILLDESQSKYFRLCSNCDDSMMRQGINEYEK